MHVVESIHNHVHIYSQSLVCTCIYIQLAHKTKDAGCASYIINKLNKATQNNYNKMKTYLTITTFSIAIIM